MSQLRSRSRTLKTADVGSRLRIAQSVAADLRGGANVPFHQGRREFWESAMLSNPSLRLSGGRKFSTSTSIPRRSSTERAYSVRVNLGRGGARD